MRLREQERAHEAATTGRVRPDTEGTYSPPRAASAASQTGEAVRKVLDKHGAFDNDLFADLLDLFRDGGGGAAKAADARAANRSVK